MIFINNNSFSFREIAFVSAQKLSEKNLEIWEFEFWSFVAEWFNEKDFIKTKTSGSTGKPKTIFHKKKYCIASAEATCKFFNLQKGNTALLCLPISSIGAKMMFIRSLVFDLDLYVQKPNSQPLEKIKIDIDFAAMVPLQVLSTFENNIEKWQYIKTLIIGGGVVNNSLKNKIEIAGLNAFSTFGMTETISHIALNKIGENNNYNALENVFFTKNEDDCLVIEAKYLGIEKLETKDIINLKNHKTFEWLGRKDNAIESGGFKFLPEVLEQKISSLISVPFFISSLPNEKLNNEIVLIVNSKNRLISKEDLKTVLDKYELPKQIFFLPKFKFLHSGKIDKKSSLALVKK